jgi:hypothetical protein
MVGKPRHRWEDNIKIDLKEIGWEAVDWIHLAQYSDQWPAVVNVVKLSGSLKSGELLD